MVFLIQNTQNRDTEAMQIKLDELIRATEGAHNALLDLEELEERSSIACAETTSEMAEVAHNELASARQGRRAERVSLKR